MTAPDLATSLGIACRDSLAEPALQSLRKMSARWSEAAAALAQRDYRRFDQLMNRIEPRADPPTL